MQILDVNQTQEGWMHAEIRDVSPFMLLSASVNSISSMPSPVYQCKKAFRLNMAVNCSEIRLKSSWKCQRTRFEKTPLHIYANLRSLLYSNNVKLKNTIKIL